MPALWRGRGPALLAVLLLLQGGLYLSYVDLLPTGFWRYGNVHYFGWTFAGYALLAWLLARDVAAGRRRVVGWVALALTAVLVCVHLDPVPAGAGEAAKMLDFPAVPPPFAVAYFDPWVLRDAAGDVDDITMARWRADAFRAAGAGAAPAVPGRRHVGRATAGLARHRGTAPHPDRDQPRSAVLAAAGGLHDAADAAAAVDAVTRARRRRETMINPR